MDPWSVTTMSEGLVATSFLRNQVSFLQDGAVEIYFLGIKNDYDRTGFRVHLPQ